MLLILTFLSKCLNCKLSSLITDAQYLKHFIFRRNKLWLYEWCKWTCTSNNLVWYSEVKNRTDHAVNIISDKHFLIPVPC